MKINLNEISEEGVHFCLTRESGELGTSLTDLISTKPYRFKAHLRSIGCGSYQLIGTMETSLETVCSRCGQETTHSLNTKFNDLLLNKNLDSPSDQSSPTGETQGKSTGQPLEIDSSALDVSYYEENHIFCLGAFAHEVIALSEPYKIYCDDCLEPGADLSQPVYTDPAGKADPDFDKRNSPFSALKDLNLDGK